MKGKARVKVLVNGKIEPGLSIDYATEGAGFTGMGTKVPVGHGKSLDIRIQIIDENDPAFLRAKVEALCNLIDETLGDGGEFPPRGYNDNRPFYWRTWLREKAKTIDPRFAMIRGRRQ